MENVKILGESETIRIEFAGREEHLEISGNGNVRTNSVTSGETINIFRLREQTGSHSNQQNASGYTDDWDAFNKQSQYIQLLVQVQGTAHNVHKELEEAIEKIKELTYQG